MRSAVVNLPPVALNTGKPRPSPIRRLVRWGMAVALAAVAAWLSLRHVRWRELGNVLAQASPWLLLLALGIVLLTTLAKAFRWRVLLRPCAPTPTLWRVLRVLWIGLLGNSFLPARLGDAARVLLLGPAAEGGYMAVLGTLLIEKALDGLAGLVVLLVLGLSTQLPSWLRQPALALAALTALLLLVIASAAAMPRQSARLFGRIASRLPAGLRDRVGRAFSGLRTALGVVRSPSDVAVAIASTAIVWALAILTNVVVLAALNMRAPGWSVWLVAVAVYVATFLPTLPAHIGVFEGACVLALTAGGVSPNEALAFALVLHLIVYLPPAVVGSACAAAEGLGWPSLRPPQHQAGAPQ